MSKLCQSSARMSDKAILLYTLFTKSAYWHGTGMSRGEGEGECVLGFAKESLNKE